MSIEELLNRYRDGLLALAHKDYAELAVTVCGHGIAVQSAINLAKAAPHTRLTNVIRFKLLRFAHQQETGEFELIDRSGLDLS